MSTTHPYTTWDAAAEAALRYLWGQASVTPTPLLDVATHLDSALRDENQLHNVNSIGFIAVGVLLHAEVEFEDVLDMLIERQRKYGHENIMKDRGQITPQQAILVRMGDKLGRLENSDEDFEDDSVLDAWMDLVGYTVIYRMVQYDWFMLDLADARAQSVWPPPEPRKELFVRAIHVRLINGSEDRYNRPTDGQLAGTFTPEQNMYVVEQIDAEIRQRYAYPMDTIERLYILDKLEEVPTS